jgi:hypothetical protein
VGREGALDGGPDRAEKLAGLGVLVGRVSTIGDARPRVGVEGDLTVLPRPPSGLHPRLEQGELVRPGREAAVATEVVELGEDRHQRIVCALPHEIVQGRSVTARTAVDLMARRGHEQRVQLADRAVPLRARAPQALQPGVRRGVGGPERHRNIGTRRRHGDDHRKRRSVTSHRLATAAAQISPRPVRTSSQPTRTRAWPTCTTSVTWSW